MDNKVISVKPPTRRDLMEAGIAGSLDSTIKLGTLKPVIRAHKVKIFDMSKPNDLKEYCKIMKKLTEDIQKSKCTLWANEKQFVSDNNGNSTWKKYLEWTEYDLVDDIRGKNNG